MTNAALAKSVAAAYRRKVWWADREDLEQEAALQIVDAERNFDPRVGVPRTAYLRRAAVLGCRNALLAASAPVSARRKEELKGLHRAPLTDEHVDPAPGPEEEVGRARWLNAVADRLFALAMEDEEVAVGLQMLRMEVQPSTYAERSGLPRKVLYRCRRKAKEAVARDRQLFELWDCAPTG